MSCARSKGEVGVGLGCRYSGWHYVRSCRGSYKVLLQVRLALSRLIRVSVGHETYGPLRRSASSHTGRLLVHGEIEGIA